MLSAIILWALAIILVLGSKVSLSKQTNIESSWIELNWKFNFETIGIRIDRFTEKVKSLTKESK